MLWDMYSGYGAHSFHPDFSALSTHPCLHLPLINSHQSKCNKQILGAEIGGMGPVA